MSTVPYLFTDLLSPSSLQNSMESVFVDSLAQQQPQVPAQQEKNNNKGGIPVRTWSRGSPIKKGNKHNEARDEPRESDPSFDDGGLAEYLNNMELLDAEPGSAAQHASDLLHSGLDMDDDEMRSFMMPVDEEMDGGGPGQREEDENDYEPFEENAAEEEEEPQGKDVAQAIHAVDPYTVVAEDVDDASLWDEELGDDEDEGDEHFEYDEEPQDDEEQDREEDEGEQEEEGGEENGGEEDEEYEQDDEEFEEEEEEEEEEEAEEDDQEDQDDDDDDDDDGEEKSEEDGPLASQFADMFDDPEKFLSMASYRDLYRDGHLLDADDDDAGGEGAAEAAQEDDKDMRAIVNDYTELLAYMDSPRGNAAVAAPSKAQQKAFLRENLSFILKNGNIVDSSSQKKPTKDVKPVEKKKSKPNLAEREGQRTVSKKPSSQLQQAEAISQPDFVFPTNINAVSQMYCEPPALPKKKKKKDEKSKLSKNKQTQKKKKLDPKVAREVAMRHKAMLQEIANKRREEEEELLLLAQQQEQKRKKFRDALLEKAMRARQQQQAEEDEHPPTTTADVELPSKKNAKANKAAHPPPPAVVHTKPLPANSSLLQPTAAYKLQTVQKTHQEDAVSEEDAKRMEEEKREYIAAMRRKFKEQHKLILTQLAEKKREEQEKTEQEQALEEKRRERRKKKLMQLLSAGRDLARDRERDDDNDDNEDHAVRARSATTFLSQKTESATTAPPALPEKKKKTSQNVAGSALAVVRQRTSVSQPGFDKTRRATREREANNDGDDDNNDEEEDGEEAERALQKRQRAKANNAKLAEYLVSLTEQKKKEELEKRKKEERQKKRVALLSQRLLQEAQERRLMAAEDAAKHRHAAEDKEKEKEREKSIVSKKVTPEMAESIAQRLRTKQSVALSESAATATPAAAAVSTKIPRPLRGAPAAERSSSSGVAAENSENSNNSNTNNSNNTNGALSGAATASSSALSVPARDYADWKRKHGVPADARVFCMTGWYPCVKQALLDRGWHFNADPLSPFFHLKWTLRSIDVNQETLQPWQLTNHYLKNVAITTKAGLIKSLQSVVWLADVDCKDIIPRAYDLSLQDDMRAFLDDFRAQKAEGLLKKLYFQVTGREHVMKSEKKEKEKKRPSFAAVGSGVNLVKSRAQSREKPRRPRNSSSNKGEGEGESEANQDKDKEEIEYEKDKDHDQEQDKHEEREEDKVEEDEEMLAQHGEGEENDGEGEENNDEDAVPPCPPTKPGLDLQTVRVNAVVFEALCHLLECALRPVDDEFLDETRRSGAGATLSLLDAALLSSGRAVSDLDWELVSGYSLFQAASSLPFDAPEPADGFLSRGRDRESGNGGSGGVGGESELQEIALAVAASTAGGGGGGNGSIAGNAQLLSSFQQQQLQQQLARERKRTQRLQEEAREDASQRMKTMRALTMDDLQRVHRLLCRLHVAHGSQAPLNGQTNRAENIWIVKPAAKSRGRGITTFNDLPKLLKYVEAGSGLSTQWVVQKYMENPLIIAKRKFDLRQWVLVTDWNPLTVYFYRECYARFSVEEYTTEQGALDNAFVHLVNNSIGKNSEHFNKTVTAENGEEIEGYMWSYESFRKYIMHQTGKDLVMDKITPRMKEITQYSLMCASEMIEHRKNSWELYGFDFMVDDEHNAWLIEINSSPACDYSTKVTERYIQKALVELLNVVLDVREWDAQPKKSHGDKPDTGDWEMIYQGPLLKKPIGSFGTEMSLKGEGLKTNRPRPAPVAVSTLGVETNLGGPSTSLGSAPSPALSITSSAKRPTAGGISYAPSSNASSSVKRSAPVASSASTSSRRVASNTERKNPPRVETDEESLSHGDFDDSDEEQRQPRKTDPPPSTRGLEITGNKPANNNKAAFNKATSQQATVPVNTAAIPVKVFNVDF